MAQTGSESQKVNIEGIQLEVSGTNLLATKKIEPGHHWLIVDGGHDMAVFPDSGAVIVSDSEPFNAGEGLDPPGQRVVSYGNLRENEEFTVKFHDTSLIRVRVVR